MDTGNFQAQDNRHEVGIAVRWPKAAWRCVGLLAGAMLAWPAILQAQAREPVLGAFSQRAQWIAAFDKLPEDRLRAYFLRCDRESREHLLPMDDAVLCAMAWDALLKRGFANDYEALLAWWRAQRDAAATASTR